MRKTLFILHLIFLTSCGATGPRYQDVTWEKADGMAEIIVFRKKQFADGGSCYAVYLNDIKLGLLANGGFIRSLVDPGQYTVTIPHLQGKILEVSFEAEEDDQIFIEYNSSLKNITAIPIGYVVLSNSEWENNLAVVKSEYARPLVLTAKDSSDSPSCMGISDKKK